MNPIPGAEALKLVKFLLLCALALVSQANADQSSYVNPLLTSGNADPCVVPNNMGTYYLYTTGDNKTYKYHDSINLVNWSPRNTIIWTPGDNSVNVWAPDVRWDPAINKYVMMATKDFKVVAATGTSLDSEFTQVSSTQFPLIQGGIDPFMFRDWDGKYYLYYAYWATAAGWTEIMAREMPTSTSWNGITAQHRVILRYSSAAEGEDRGGKPLVEGPEVWRDRDTYYMIYSNADWLGPNYRACYATAKHPMGPWVKARNNPLIVRDDAKGVFGPGHGGNFTDAGGRLWYMYQQRPDGSTDAGLKRQLCIDRLMMDPITRQLSLSPTRGTTQTDGPIYFPGNTMPVCSVTAPSYGSLASAGSSVNFSVNASDADGNIAKVEMYIDGTLVQTDSSAPYTHTWPANGGIHWFEAVATDNRGAVVKADAVKVTVGNQPPLVTVAHPVQTYVGYNRAEYLQVNASDADGTVGKVDFYADDVFIASDSAPPYSCTYTVPTKGYVRLKAYATDNEGAVGNMEWPVYPWDKSAQTTFNGIKSIPGSYEAEDFDAITDSANPASVAPDPDRNASRSHDTPGHSISYFKFANGWNGASTYRPNTKVTLPATQDSSGAYDLADVEDGDWYEYTCNVLEAGYYHLTLRANSTSNLNNVLVTSDGAPLHPGGFASLPATSGYQNIAINNLYFSKAGQQRVRFNFGSTANKTLKLNQIALTAASSPLFSISGSVTLNGGAALSNATVSNGIRSTLTDSNGHYVLADVTEGAHSITALKPGYSIIPNPLSVTVAGASLTDKSFTATLLAPVLAPAQKPFFYMGSYFSYQIEATGSPVSYTLVNGSLPSGLAWNPSTGVVSGIPTTLGSFSVTFTATNSSGTGSAQTITFIVAPALIIAEGFDYPVGTNSPDPDAGVNNGYGLPAVNSNGNPAGTSTGLYGAWGTTTDVAPGLSYSQGTKALVSAGGAGNVNNATWGGQVFVYRSMTIDPYLLQRIDSSTTTNFGRPGSSLHISFLGQTSSGTADAFRLSFKHGGIANFYVSNTATGWSLNGTPATGVPLALNTSTLFVLRFNFGSPGNTSVNMWVNPSLGNALPAPQATVNGLDFPGLSSFQTRAAVAGAMTVDELRVGFTPESVMPFLDSKPTNRYPPNC